MKLSGKVVYQDLEGGLYLLEASNGNTYILDGGGSDLLSDGVKADVEGWKKPTFRHPDSKLPRQISASAH